MACGKIKDPARKARCLEAQRLLKKEVTREALGGQGNNKISGTMRVGHGMNRDTINFNDGSVRKILKNKKQ